MRSHFLQKGNITLVMVAVLMTIGLLLMASLQYYQERARDELNRETKYFIAFNHAESALAWGAQQLWKKNITKNANWECKQELVQKWQSCLKHYKAGSFILSGQSHFKQGEEVKVYRWVTFVAGSEKLQLRQVGWLDYCPVDKKGFCL